MKITPVFAIGALLLLNSCARESANRETPETDSIIDGGTCQFQANEGEAAQRPGGSPSQSDLTELGKKMDLRFFQAVLRASIRETAGAIESTGLQLVQVNTPRRFTCSPLSFLQSASSAMNAFWSSRVRSGFVLLGMFLPRLDSDNPDRRATIVVRPDTTRWTLVHEYMHALYEFERERIGQPTSDARFDTFNDAADTLERELDRCEKGSCTNIQEALQAFTRFADLRLSLELDYALEEIAIETQLARKFVRKELLYVHNDLQGAHEYSDSSFQKSKLAFEKLSKNLRWFSDLSVSRGAQSRFNADAAEVKILAPWRTSLARAEELVKELYMLQLQHGRSFYSLSTSAPKGMTRHCSHSMPELRELEAR